MIEPKSNAIERNISIERNQILIEPIEYNLELSRSIEIQLRSTIEFQPFDRVQLRSIGSIIEPVRLRSSGYVVQHKKRFSLAILDSCTVNWGYFHMRGVTFINSKQLTFGVNLKYVLFASEKIFKSSRSVGRSVGSKFCRVF